MNPEKKLKIVLITGQFNSLIAELIERFNGLQGASFENVVFWKPSRTPWEKIKKNLKKHGIIYIPYRFFRVINKLIIQRVREQVETLFLFPKAKDNLIASCHRFKLQIHEIKDIHAQEGVDLIRSLNCDLLVVCGTGILKKTVFDLPRIGTINVHQGDAQKYRGAPPGFWELWNDEKEAGVTIHFVDAGIDTGDIILQKRVPIFDYDNLQSLKRKLDELLLTLYPEAIKLIIEGKHKRTSQAGPKGKLYTLPSLSQRFRLFLKLKRRHFQLFGFIKNVLKKIVFIFGLTAIYCRDFVLRRIAKKNILSALYYHRVTDICQDGMTIGSNDFEWQIRFLKKNYHVISALELNDWLEGGKNKGKKGVLITFDDGYEDNYTRALPILKKYSSPAIFFVSTGMIDNNRQFEHDKILQPRLTFNKMTWSQLKEASSSNVEIGIHSDTHANLGIIPLEESIKEFEDSIQKYKLNLNKNPDLMSYPFGQKNDITPEVIEYLKNNKQIRALFSAYGNKNMSPINRWNIKRINIGSKDTGLIYWFKVEGGLATLSRPYER